MISLNEHLLSIHRVSERMPERSGLVCLDRNERVTPYSQDVFQEMLTKLSPELFSHYPDTSPLYERLAQDLSIPQDYLYLTPGSDAALRMLFQTYLRPRDIVVLAEPSYAMYSLYTQIFQATPRFVVYDSDLHLKVDAWRESLQTRPRLSVLANPDQPTGAILQRPVLRELAEMAHRLDVLFIIDEAYYPFYPETALHLIREFNNIVVTRTFSKVGGLAGLRLGYCVAHPRVIESIARVRGAHEVNAVAVAMGTYILDHPDVRQRLITDLEAGRQVLLAVCRVLGVTCPPCPTNFQLLRFKGLSSTDNLVSLLKKKGYLVKGRFADPVQDCIRVTLAEPNVMQGFSKALKVALGDIRWIPHP